MRNVFLFCCLILSALAAHSQEGLKPLSSNLNYYYDDLNPRTMPDLASTAAKTQSASLQIPFLDDFYYATLKKYPRMDLWKDSSVYVNPGFPIAPPSIGVATFDGLNKFGYPYDPNLINMNESLPADTLCSRPINLFQSGSQILQPSDSIALSFYYQARGNGESPEATDSLLLDFYKPNQNKWISNIWYKKGNANPNISDTAFYRAFIWIKDVDFLADSFQFRFRNKATTAGNFDHWHVDYVYLNKNRSIIADTIYNDLTFGTVPSSFLENYTAMPYEQFKPEEMGDSNNVRIKNNGGQAINMYYKHNVYDKNDLLVHTYDGGADNLGSFKTNGYSKYKQHARPSFNYTYSPMTDTCSFRIKHYLYRSQTTSSDFLNHNDTIYQFQDFKNYYAYDDGSAESGYYVNALNAKIAIRFRLNYPDTLRAVRIYFDPAGSISTVEQSYQFKINIWAAAGSSPGSLVYADSEIKLPKYTDDVFKGVSEYKLSSPITTLVPGTDYFIGIQQKVANGIVIGYDMNQDYHKNLYYDYGAGWMQSQIGGAVMIRPVFGKYVPPPVSVDENHFNNLHPLLVYPNPGNDVIYVLKDKDDERQQSCSIINTLGQVILEEKLLNERTAVSVGALPNGIYFLIFKEGSKPVQQKKIIIQH